MSLSLEFRETYAEQERYSSFMRWLGPRLRRIWGFGHFGLRCTKEWRAISGITQIGEEGNVITMGGIGGELNNGLRAERTEKTRPRWLGFSRLSTPISNTLKVLAGFIPALVTFLYTQEWWVLAWFGAPLWFLITGLRNIPQAILGGGGMWSRSLLRWNDYVSWTRVCDSLLYTGLSVPLLEYFIRVLLLEDGLGLTVKDHQFLVFSIIAGRTASTFRCTTSIGVPQGSHHRNLFRSLLAIPVSVFYNDVLALFLPFFTTADPLLILEPGAAIISKTASDTVAAIIEGLADWRNNRRLRYWDYETKLQRLFDCYAKLELAFPDQDILSLLSRPEEFTRLTSTEARSLQVESIINALDLMYFWLYQPCAQQTLTSILRTMTREERVIVAGRKGFCPASGRSASFSWTACSGAISPAPCPSTWTATKTISLHSTNAAPDSPTAIVRCSGAGGIYRIAFNKAGRLGEGNVSEKVPLSPKTCQHCSHLSPLAMTFVLAGSLEFSGVIQPNEPLQSRKGLPVWESFLKGAFSQARRSLPPPSGTSTDGEGILRSPYEDCRAGSRACPFPAVEKQKEVL